MKNCRWKEYAIEKRLFGPANYYRCMAERLSELKMLPQKPDLSRYSPGERQAMQLICGAEKRLFGPARFYRCIEIQELRRPGFFDRYR